MDVDSAQRSPRKAHSGLKVKVKSWHTAAAWKWQVKKDEESCGICRCPFDSFCPTCKVPGDDCPPVWGKCTHLFHMHCILSWISDKDDEQQQCPLCRQQWKFKD